MTRVLLSVPPHLRDFIHSPAGRRLWSRRLAEVAGGSDVFVGADPRSRRLGSGGGTVGLLVQAWRDGQGRHGKPLPEWLRGDQRLVLHGGGESRRLPAYAALGKVFLPMPAVDGLAPRRFDQMLADFQIPAYQQVLREAGTKAAVLVTAGDVWLDFDPLQIPAATADITGIGMRVAPEVARNFGVYFVARDQGHAEGCEHPIAFFRQKPAADEIHRLSARYDYFVDTGMWLLSLEALNLLFRRCGWDEKRGRFATADGHPGHMDLYTEIGSALGRETRAPDRLRRLGWSRLRAAVIPLEDARFYHLGSSRQLFESFELAYGAQTLWPAHCVQGSEGAEFHPALDLPQAELILRKGFRTRVDSYSAFFENDRSTPTGLAGYLRERDLRRVFLAGLAYDYCVGYSALDARRLGLPAFVLRDACRAIGLGGTVAAIEAQFAGAGVVVIETAQLSG